MLIPIKLRVCEVTKAGILYILTPSSSLLLKGLTGHLMHPTLAFNLVCLMHARQLILPFLQRKSAATGSINAWGLTHVPKGATTQFSPIPNKSAFEWGRPQRVYIK